MKVPEQKALKQRITNLAKEQFGGLLKEVRFSGPFEDEDFDADIILRNFERSRHKAVEGSQASARRWVRCVNWTLV